MRTMTLSEILAERPHWRTDKGTDHSYIAGFYEEALAPYRDRPVTLVEIGAQFGWSLLLWDRYFTHHDTRIYGVDNRAYQMIHDLPGRVWLIDADAYNPKVAANAPAIDIFIDDGPHSLESQLDAIRLYLPRMKEGGLFVIEDIQTDEERAALLAAIPAGLHWKIYDGRETSGRSDDVLLAIHAGVLHVTL